MDNLEKQLLLDALKKEIPEFSFEFQNFTLQNDQTAEIVFIDFGEAKKAPLFNPTDYQGIPFDIIAAEMCYKLKLLSDTQYQIRDTLLSDTYIKDNVQLQLINTQRNKSYLKDKLHFKVNNELSAIYYVPFNENSKERGIIANGLIQELDLDPAELTQAAIANMTSKIELQYLSEIADNINAYIDEVMHGHDTSEIMDKLKNGNLDTMVVLSNHSREYGAASVLCSDFLKNCEQDLIILPSSIHEVMLLPYTQNTSDLKQLQSIVEYVNQTTISEQDFLSDNVYLFDHKSQQVSLACDKYGLVPICDDTLMKISEKISKFR